MLLTCAQIASQQRATTVKPRAHRAHGASECRRRIGIAELVQVAQDDGLPIAHGQRDDRFPKRRKIALPFQIAQRIARDCQRRGARLLVERGRPADGASAAHVITSNPEQPQLRLRPPRTIARRALDDGDECFVNDVFRSSLRPTHMSSKPGYDGFVAPVQFRKGLPIARSDSRDENVVRRQRFVSHARCRIRRPHHVFSWPVEKFPVYGWNFLASILAFTLKRSNVVSSTVSAPSARRSLKGHFIPSTSR